MCMRRECPTCKKASWYGCGQHIPRVMDNINKDDWCTCAPKRKEGSKLYPPKAGEGSVEVGYEDDGQDEDSGRGQREL